MSTKSTNCSTLSQIKGQSRYKKKNNYHHHYYYYYYPSKMFGGFNLLREKRVRIQLFLVIGILVN